MPGPFAELGLIYEGLGMLHADADGEGLCDYLHPAGEEHAVGIPCGLAEREYHGAAGELFIAVDCDGETFSASRNFKEHAAETDAVVEAILEE